MIAHWNPVLEPQSVRLLNAQWSIRLDGRGGQLTTPRGPMAIGRGAGDALVYRVRAWAASDSADGGDLWMSGVHFDLRRRGDSLFYDPWTLAAVRRRDVVFRDALLLYETETLEGAWRVEDWVSNGGVEVAAGFVLIGHRGRVQQPMENR